MHPSAANREKYTSRGRRSRPRRGVRLTRSAAVIRVPHERRIRVRSHNPLPTRTLSLSSHPGRGVGLEAAQSGAGRMLSTNLIIDVITRPPQAFGILRRVFSECCPRLDRSLIGPMALIY
ncbi:hypothetical protein EVAR_41770_1 [Eumeta japonica]|uniref:Uncharacterized protein n=1 Tax=Eumeta variegata TaxID=151549 RepID=A0A4C1W176_EUMVA|nr:hypothetical protein EVAR_41770_1 [Eumeta japonica]